MNLNNFFLTQQKYRSPASRNSFKFISENLIFKNFKKLTIKKKNKSGRSSFGRIIFRTRTSFLFKKFFYNINYNLNKRMLGTINSFSFIPFKNKLLTLIFFCDGSAFYFLTNNFFVLFSFFYNKIDNKSNLKIIKFKTNYFYLYQIPKLSIVSSLEIYPRKGVQFVKSSGTGAKLLSHDKKNYISFVKLPSGIKKIFSSYSFSFFGRISLVDNKYFKSGKAGY